jgi:hypothetical protein
VPDVYLACGRRVEKAGIDRPAHLAASSDKSLNLGESITVTNGISQCLTVSKSIATSPGPDLHCGLRARFHDTISGPGVPGTYERTVICILRMHARTLRVVIDFARWTYSVSAQLYNGARG